MTPRFPERGRNNQTPKDSYTSRLNSAVTADPHHVTWHRPEHRSDSIEPDTALRDSFSRTFWPGVDPELSAHNGGDG